MVSQPSRRPGVGAEPAAELGALGREHAPTALPAGDDPVVQHPDVDELVLVSADRGALLRAHVLGADHTAVPVREAEAAVGVVLVPMVVRSREPNRLATRIVDEVAQPD